MSDLFISYSSKNRELIKPLVKALERNGWTVWWDRKISIGARYDQEILQALDDAKCVIVVWTKDSVDSDWVRYEASRADGQNKLFPIRLEDVDPPLGFGVIQTANLTDWDGKSAHKEFSWLVQTIGEKCSRTAPADLFQEEIPLNPPTQKLWPILLLVVLPIIVGLFSWFIPVNSADVVLKATVSEFSFVSAAQQELSDPLIITSIKAAGLSQVEIPGTSELPHESITEKEGMLGTILVTSGSGSEGSGDITLDSIRFSPNVATRVVKTSRPFEFNLTFDQTNQEIRINVKGSVDIMVPGIGVKHRIFSFPKPLLIQPGPSGLDLEITIAELPDNLLPSPLSVTRLGFVRVDERRGDERTTIQKVSTILNRSFVLDGEPQHLKSEEYLQFEHSEGSLKIVRLNQENIEIEFHGQVQGMKSCHENSQCISLMPSHWEALVIKYSTLIMVGSIVYLGLIVAGGIRWWKYK